MKETFEFKVPVSDGFVTFIVYKTYLTICPNPEKVNLTEHYYSYKVSSYLHNIDGPALIYQDGRKFYYVNGFGTSEQHYPRAVKIFLSLKFNNKLNKLLDDK